MRKDRSAPQGQVHRLSLASKVLEGNLQGDPLERDLDVYMPPGYDGSNSLPLLVDAAGFTSSGLSHTNWRAFTENVPE